MSSGLFIPNTGSGGAGGGTAATVTIGTTTTGAPGSLASVSNSGTATDAVFNFNIPRGDQGPAGPIAGSNGQIIANVSGTATGLTPLGLSISGTNLATLADVYIPLSDAATALTASTTVAKKTTPYLRTAMVLTDLPVWAVSTAPTGSTLQFDIKVNGTSIYSTLPTIAAGSTNSSASPGTFSTAFTTSSNAISSGSSISYFVTQVGSTTAGAGLEVILATRRAG
jgi:hypothetical protein